MISIDTRKNDKELLSTQTNPESSTNVVNPPTKHCFECGSPSHLVRDCAIRAQRRRDNQRQQRFRNIGSPTAGQRFSNFSHYRNNSAQRFNHFARNRTFNPQQRNFGSYNGGSYSPRRFCLLFKRGLLQ